MQTFRGNAAMRYTLFQIVQIYLFVTAIVQFNIE